MENLKEIELYFQDLEILRFKASVIKDVIIEFDEKNNAEQFQIILDKKRLYSSPDVTSLTYHPEKLSKDNIREYIEAKFPSIKRIHLKYKDDNEKTISITWSILPNTSLQDCMCEPVNGNAYSEVHDNQIVVGAHKDKYL